MKPDSKTISLVASAVLIIITGVLISQGWLDESFGGLVLGLLTGAGTGGFVGYAAGRSANAPSEQERAVLELDRRINPAPDS